MNGSNANIAEPSATKPTSSMKIGITGGTGFIGSQVAQQARRQGHDVVIFSRRADSLNDPHAELRSFSPGSPPDLSGLDAVINLAGASIFGLWTKARRKRIIDSRIRSTRGIVEAIAALARDGAPLPSLINGSAIGFYGDTGDHLVEESDDPGEGFLSEVCRAWEAEAHKAEACGARVVCLRTGFVIGRGGAMALIGPFFRWGLGGRLGDGRQWMSGIHVDDVAGLILWAAANPSVQGPLNAVMPEPFRNIDFTREVARTVHRPALLPTPKWALRFGLGELSRLLLDSSRVQPRRAEEGGYVFRFASLPRALQDTL